MEVSKKVQIIENKNKYHLIIRAKGNEYLYKTNQKNSQHVLECLKKYCPRIDKIGIKYDYNSCWSWCCWGKLCKSFKKVKDTKFMVLM